MTSEYRDIKTKNQEAKEKHNLKMLGYYIDKLKSCVQEIEAGEDCVVIPMYESAFYVVTHQVKVPKWLSAFKRFFSETYTTHLHDDILTELRCLKNIGLKVEVIGFRMPWYDAKYDWNSNTVGGTYFFSDDGINKVTVKVSL